MNRLTLSTASALVAGLLTACGNNSDSNPDQNAQDNTGALVGSLFQGLNYRIADQQGQLDAMGQYPHTSGAMIKFSVGGVQLASVPSSAATLSPQHVWNTALSKNVNVLGNRLWNQDLDSLDVLANQMIFLAALDNDTNAANGFNLADWHERLADESIDFNLRFPDFVDTELRAFQERHDLSQDVAFHGLQGLYDATGTPLNYYLTSTKTRHYESGNSGSKSRWETTYDEDGRVIEEVRYSDNGADDIIDRVSTYNYTYNTDGQRTRVYYTEDRTMDGQANRIEEDTYEYNLDGKQTLHLDREDSNADGIWDRINRKQTQYDADNRKTRDEHYTTTYPAPNTPVTSTEITTYTYNEAGLLSTQSYVRDTESDGVIDSEGVYTYGYNAEGKQTLYRFESDGNSDGNVDMVNTTATTYDNNGHVTSRTSENDFDGDGQLDAKTRHEYVYNAEGMELEYRYFQDSRNNDGVLDRLTERLTTRDESGEVVSQLERVDEDLFDGQFDSQTMTTFEVTRSETGQIVRSAELFDYGNNGTVDSTEVELNSYDASGLRTERRTEYDDNNDGTVDQAEGYTWSYDDNHSVVEQIEISDKFADGVFERKTTSRYTYEAVPTDVESNLGYINLRLKR